MIVDTSQQILETIGNLKKASVQEIISHLPEAKSRQWISTILNKLSRQGKLSRAKMGKHVFYVLPQNKDLLAKKVVRKLVNNTLAEDKVFADLKKAAPFLTGINENIESILFYAFTEMLNNAIEHSESKTIEVKIEKIENKIAFEVLDKGIGVYKNIKNKNKLNSELDAIGELLKGKTTTLPHSHTGEGIFFTSKIADIFILDSYGYRLRIDKLINDIFVEEIDNTKGTSVRFELNENSDKHLNDVFRLYQSEPGSYSFDKTRVYIKLYTAGTVYISRSQARRLLTNLDKFTVIILDFEGLKTIGQAFADEIFRVFKARHPDIELSPINTNEAVTFMIDRAKKDDQLPLIEE